MTGSTLNKRPNKKLANSFNNVLLTGFTPFDGRQVNASWIAANAGRSDTVDTLEIPVIWGSPMKLLKSYCGQHCPTTIIAMGEGREGWFDIETIAQNSRQERPDNDGTLPEGKLISPEGPPIRMASCNAAHLQKSLMAAKFPTRISTDAGQFLCEEMLYTLETLKEEHTELQQVFFCHVPPHGSDLHIEGEITQCNEELLKNFTKQLLTIVLNTQPVNHSDTPLKTLQ